MSDLNTPFFSKNESDNRYYSANKGTQLEEMVSNIADGSGGKSYPDITTAMAVSPLPGNNVLFSVDQKNKEEAGVYAYDSTQPTGYRWVRGFTDGKVEQGNLQPVAGGEVFGFIDNTIIPGNNLINTKGNFLRGSWGGDVGTVGTFTPSDNWLSLKPIFLDGKTWKEGQSYIVSGLDRMGTASIRFQFRNSAGVVLANVLGTGTSNIIPQGFTWPAGAFGLYPNISSRSGSGLDLENSPLHKTLMFAYGVEVLPYEKYGKKLNLLAKRLYIAPDGNDNYRGLGRGFPIKTLARAKELLDPDGELVFLAGDYYDFDIDFSAFYRMRGEVGKKVRFIYGERITSASLVEGYTKVYSYAYNHPGTWLTNRYRLWQHDIEDPRSEILMNKRTVFHRGLKYRLQSTGLDYVASIAEVENSPIPCYYYDTVNKILYFQKVAGSDLSRNPVVISKPADIITNSVEKKVSHSNLSILYKTLATKNLSGELYSFDVMYVNTGSGCINFTDTINLRIIKPRAGGSSNDGLNGSVTISTVTDPFNNYLDVTMEDVWIHDCKDDGESHHNHSRVFVHGGLGEYCQNGFTAASGCHAAYYNVTAQNNYGNGFAAQGESLDGGIGTNIQTFGCLSIENGRNYVGRDADTRYVNCISKAPVSGTHYSGSGQKFNSVELA